MLHLNVTSLCLVAAILLPRTVPQRTKPQDGQLRQPPQNVGAPYRGRPPPNMRRPQNKRHREFTEPHRSDGFVNREGSFQPGENFPRARRPPPNWVRPANRSPRPDDHPLRELTPQFDDPVYPGEPEQSDIILPQPVVPAKMGRPVRLGGPQHQGLPPRNARHPQMDAAGTPSIPWADLNDRPVIGVLTEASKIHVKNYGNNYVRNEYIKFVEMTGAYITLVLAGKPPQYYQEIFQRINGLFLPGGGAPLLNSTFTDSTRILLDLAMKANDNGDYFPVWGTCLGLEVMVVLAAEKRILHETDSSNISLPLTLSPDYKESRMLGNAPQEIINYLTTENITANFHIMSLLTETYHQLESVNKLYRIVSTNKGRDGKEFVSTIEAHRYPFFAVQWHPEKPIYLKRPDLAIPTSEHAVKVGHYFANFFISEARKSQHRFSSAEERSRLVVGDEDAYCLPKIALEHVCSVCKCCKLDPQHSWSTDLCLIVVTCLCLALFYLYVWPTLKIFPSAKQLTYHKCK